jgi:hypothetical protein
LVGAGTATPAQLAAHAGFRHHLDHQVFDLKHIKLPLAVSALF